MSGTLKFNEKSHAKKTSILGNPLGDEEERFSFRQKSNELDKSLNPLERSNN
jgi:hypothetical protein